MTNTISENSTCIDLCKMVLSHVQDVSERLMNLENSISVQCCMPINGECEDMAKKINRTVKLDGKQCWIRADSEQEYAEKLLELKHANEQTTQKTEFAAFALNWYELYSKPNIETATAVNYERQLKRHILPRLGKMYIQDITVDDIQALFNGIAGKKTTKDKTKMVLNMIFEAAIEENLIQKNPVKSKRLRITGEASEATKVYSIEQMRYLVQNVDKIQNDSDRKYLVLQALHPMRLEEVLGLRWEDIDVANRVIHIRRAVTHPKRNAPEIKETKTAASTRDIGLSEIAAKYLSDGGSGFVLGGEKPLTYTQVRRMCDRIEKQSGFDEKITPIRFRTTVLTDIYDQTRDIKQAQAAAGHTTSAMTLKHYIKGRETNSSAAKAIDSVYSFCQ